MIGVVLVTHGKLAEEFISALEHVVGKQKQMAAISIESDDDMEDCRSKILAATKSADTGDGVILLTDMFGEPHRIWRSPSWSKQMSKSSPA